MTAADDIRMLRDERGLRADSIDWARLLTINYRGYVPRGGVVIDVGADDGTHSHRFRRYLGPERLFLVEPVPERAAALRREFGRRNGIAVVQVALGAEATTAEVDRLDNWNIDGRVSFIKVDAGGAELDVVLGGGQLIQRDRPIISIRFETDTAAMFGHSLESLFALLDQHDLALVDLFGNLLDEAELREIVDTYHRDYLLIPNARLANLDQTRATVRADVLRAIETFNPTVERWKKRLRF